MGARLSRLWTNGLVLFEKFQSQVLCITFLSREELLRQVSVIIAFRRSFAFGEYRSFTEEIGALKMNIPDEMQRNKITFINKITFLIKIRLLKKFIKLCLLSIVAAFLVCNHFMIDLQ